MMQVSLGDLYVPQRRHVRLVRYEVLKDVLINATANITSRHVSLEYAERAESLLLMARSATGTADVKAEYETSWDASLWDSADDNADITSSTLTDKANNAEGMNAFSMSAALNKYIRIKITGVAANPTDTLVTAYIVVREVYA